jgi:hypothetical protein
MANIIGIFTGKDLKWMQSEGGSGYWVVRNNRINNANYVLFIRNHRATFAVRDNLEHGQAFMLGKIAGCISNEEHNGRKVIQISEYSELPNIDKFKKAWKNLTGGQRYPIAYLNTDDLLRELNLDISSLSWKTFDSKLDLKSINKENQINELSEVIEQAKKTIAFATNIDINKINIHINF